MERVFGWNFGSHVVTYVAKTEDCLDIDNESIKSGIRIWNITEDVIGTINNGVKYSFKVDKEYFRSIKPGDILTINEDGSASVWYSGNEKEIDIFVTNKCNSNCIMCPLAESIRKKNRVGYEALLKEYIEALPDDIEYINITGGEPTLPQNFFLEVMSMIRNKYQYSDFQLLTNGRSSSDKYFLKRMLDVCPNGIRFAIPIHASNEIIHDEISRSEGSFKQTDVGIKNLLSEKQKVEVRIVVSKKNVEYLSETAKYIAQNYKGLFCVNFMGMEMMGNAAINKDDLWIDYSDAFEKAREAIDILVDAGIDVQLYNFPLCSVQRGYWHIAVISITEYKIRFMEECENCSVKDICGGFFYSTKQIMKPKVKPIIKV